MFKNYIECEHKNNINQSIEAYCKNNKIEFRYNMQELEIYSGYFMKLDIYVKDNKVFFKEKITLLDKATLLIKWGYPELEIKDLYENNNIFIIEKLYFNKLRSI